MNESTSFRETNVFSIAARVFHNLFLKMFSISENFNYVFEDFHGLFFL